MLTVACVYKPGNGFTSGYVSRLRDAVAKNCTAEYEFACLTDAIRIDGVRCIPFEHNRPGFWNKLELFREGLFEGPVVYLDLDTMLVSDVTDIFSYMHRFTVGDHWKRPESIASGFMAWNSRENLSYLCSKWDRTALHAYNRSTKRLGDQGYIQDKLRRPYTRLSHLFPGRLVSYKIHVVPEKRIPAGASIVAFHGRPRPHEIGWRLPSGD